MKTHKIHPTALIETGATLGEGVSVGAYAQIGSQVVLEDHVEIASHVIVTGNTCIGAHTKVFSFSCIGYPPQVTGFKDEKTQIVIGQHNLIREHVTIHPGTEKGGGITRIGNHCMIMVASHIAHDCQVGNNVIMANNATLGGHVVVGDFVIIGGLSGIHQHVKLGQGSIIGGLSGVEGHVIPYGSVMGNRARLSGLNLVGLKRRNLSRETVHALRTSYRLLFANEGTLAERIEDVKELFSKEQEVMEIVMFLKENNNAIRPFCLP